METFVWTPSYETGLSEVDAQHRGLVDIINQIGILASDSGDWDDAELIALFAKLRDYATEHFTQEEAMMSREGLDPRFVEKHSAEHRDYVAEVDQLCKGGADAETSQSVLKFLTYWLGSHILGVDHSMARQVAAIRAGTPSEEALRAEEQARAGATQPLLAALHGLLEQVAERNKTLRALNTTLEQRVTERTRELTQLVESLKQQKAESQRLSDELAEANKHLELMAMTDALTGLPNRRHAIARMERAWRESTERGTSMAVMMVDVDKFKLINDTFGHDAGDHVLVTLSKELAHAVRTDDIVCRMGGDEFLIVCPHTPSAGAKTIAESVWSRIHALRIAVGDHEWRGSISVGVAVRGPEMPSIASLIKAADEAVYAAKEGGRDRIVVAAAPAPRG